MPATMLAAAAGGGAVLMLVIVGLLTRRRRKKARAARELDRSGLLDGDKAGGGKTGKGKKNNGKGQQAHAEGVPRAVDTSVHDPDRTAVNEIKGDLERMLAESPESLAALLSNWMAK
jgi:flagellar biosynthesis/type III secretory pathway M-ring protein FliF/YscJ